MDWYSPLLDFSVSWRSYALFDLYSYPMRIRRSSIVPDAASYIGDLLIYGLASGTTKDYLKSASFL